MKPSRSLSTRAINRRGFLQRSLLGAAGSVSATGLMSSLTISKALAQTAADYKALVCVFLYGGNDSFNMVVPRSDAEYQKYADTRRTLAVAQESLLPISPLSGNGVDYGLHPGMEAVQELFNQGSAAIQANVGSLVEPTDRNSYLQQSVALPPRLFSHNDQQDFWQALGDSGPIPSGWAGRMSELLTNLNQNPNLSLNISLSGANLLQVSSGGLPYNVSPEGIVTLQGVALDGSELEQHRALAYQALLEKSNSNLFSEEFAAVRLNAQALSGEVIAALANAPAISTEFPAGSLGASLSMVAQLIAASAELGMSRQIFFVGFSGWDTHSDQLTRHPLLLSELSAALGAFYSATTELGVSSQVTTFTASDFGRTLTSNGDGSDHGWGSHQLVVGGAVNGQQIYGLMPELEIEGPQDAGQGRIIPTTAVDQYGATLARWFGVSDADLGGVFPNLGNFNSTDIGFML